jgi:hypothetical protein
MRSFVVRDRTRNRGASPDRGHEPCHRAEHVLAVVQDQQQALFRKSSQTIGKRRAL